LGGQLGEGHDREVVRLELGSLNRYACAAWKADGTQRHREYVIDLGHASAEIGGRRPAHGAAASSWEASRINTSSRP